MREMRQVVSVAARNAASAMRRTGVVAAQVSDVMRQFARSFHRPVDRDDDGMVAWCPRCGVEWPCPEFVRLDGLLTRRDSS